MRKRIKIIIFLYLSIREDILNLYLIWKSLITITSPFVFISADGPFHSSYFSFVKVPIFLRLPPPIARLYFTWWRSVCFFYTLCVINAMPCVGRHFFCIVFYFNLLFLQFYELKIEQVSVFFKLTKGMLLCIVLYVFFSFLYLLPHKIACNH